MLLFVVRCSCSRLLLCVCACCDFIGSLLFVAGCSCYFAVVFRVLGVIGCFVACCCCCVVALRVVCCWLLSIVC